MSIEINREFLEIILKLEKTASKDETRSYLCSVNLRRHAKKKDTIILESCDGHILAQRELLHNELYNKLEKSKILTSEDFTRLKKFLKEWRTTMKFYLTFEDQYLLVSCTEKTDPRFFIAMKYIDRDYPDTDKVIPKGKPNVEFGLDAELLLRVVESLGGKKSKQRVLLKICNELSGIILKVSKNDDHIGIIMPIKTEGW